MNDPEVDKSLSELNLHIGKMQALQNNAQPGLFTWNTAMRENLVNICKEAAKLTNMKVSE